MRRLRFLIRALGRRLPRRPPLSRTTYVEELPDTVAGGQLFVIGENDYSWCAAMVCPCGCGETLRMSLLPEGRPRWTFEEYKDGTPTLHPSVWHLVGCRSHFFLKRGEVRWCHTVSGTDNTTR